MEVCPKTLVASQRDALSLLSRMVLSRSTISMDGGLATVSIDPEVADLMAIERIEREITLALTSECAVEVTINVL